ncbi:MAG: autotransporter-associated beta strand repeat-containing protein [Pirellulales bacterium]|nr:autotransporter-associated beta strand repeat-containing protein [Pirellulales bacterium]
MPGEVLSYEPSPDWWDLLWNNEVYISSPAIVVMPNGDYIAAHDLFGGGSGCDSSGTTKVFYSSNKGATWTQKTTLSDTERASLFVYDGDLYLFGYSKDDGNIIVRKSTNNGASWTTPSSSTTGLIRSGGYGGSPCRPVVYNNRIWVAQSNRFMSAPIGSDLLNSSSWTRSGGVTTSDEWLDGEFTWWTEGQIVASPLTGVVVMPKIDGLPYTGLIHSTTPGGVEFNPDTDFVSLPGAEKKFGATYDPVSQKFYVLSNPVLPAHAGETTPQLTRTTAAVLSSKDCRHWDVEQIFLFTTHIDNGSWGEAFQYFNFDFDGDDMVIASRTAFDVGDEKPPRGHDSNLLTFHKIEDFRTIEPEHYLVADTSNNQVLRYEVTQHADAPLGKFTLGTTFSGAALNHPDNLAQDANGDVYIHEQGGRILRFDALGNFISVVASSPVPFQGANLDIDQPAYGERTWIATDSDDWTDTTKWYYWGRADTNYEVATFGSAIGAASTVTLDEAYTVKGLRFRNSAKYTLAGAGSLALQAESGNALIDVQQGSHDLQLPVTLGSHTDANAVGTTSLRFKHKLDLNGKKLSLGGLGYFYIDQQFVMHNGTLVLDGQTPLVFTSGSTPTLDGNLQFVPSGSLVLEAGHSYNLIDGNSYFGSETFDNVQLIDLSARYWDASTASGLQSGNGAWSTSQPQWSLSSEGTSPLQAWSLTGLAWDASDLYTSGIVSLTSTPDYNIDACFNASGTSAITVSGVVSAHAMFINSGTYTFTSANASSKINLISGAVTVNTHNNYLNAILTGNAGLIKEGGYELTLGGSYGNDYTGTTCVNNGELILDKTLGYAIPSNITMTNSSTTNYTIVRLNRSNQVNSSAVLTIVGPTDTRARMFKLLGHTQELAGISDSTGTGFICNAYMESGDDDVGELIVNNSQNFSYNGSLRDSHSSITNRKFKLTKRGAGTLTLLGSGSGAYSGGLRVENGVLDYSGGILPACDYTITGGTLNVGTLNQTVGTFQITGGTVNGTGTLTSASPYDLQAGTINAVLGGNAPLMKTGSGTVSLTGGLPGGNFTISNGVLDLNNLSKTIGAFQITGGTVNGSGALTSNAAFDVQAGAVNVRLAGSLGLTKSGSGTATLGGNVSNIYSGTTSIVNGALLLSKTTGPAVPGNVVLDSSNAYVTIILQNNDQLASSSLVTFAGNAYNSYLRLQGHSQTVAGIPSDSPYAIIENTRSESGFEGTVGVLTVNNSQNCSYAGWIRDHRNSSEGTGQLKLVKNGGGILTLIGENTGKYTGGLEVKNGTLNYSGGVLPGLTYGNYCPYAVSGGILNIGSLSQTIGTFQITGGLVTGSGTLTSNSLYDLQAGMVNAVLGGTAPLMKTGPGTVSLTGGLPGGNYSIFNGVLNLSGLSQSIGTFQITGGVVAGSGALTSSSLYDLQAGTVQLALGGTAPLTKTGSGTVSLTGGLPGGNYSIFSGTLNLNGLSQSIGTFQLLGGTVTGSGTLTSEAPFDVQNGAVNIGLAGTLGLTKAGSGTVTLGGNVANNYFGPTTLENGTLVLSKAVGPAVLGNVVFNGPSALNITGSNQISAASVLNFIDVDDWMTLRLYGNTLTVAGIRCDYPSGNYCAVIRNTEGETGYGNGTLILDTPAGTDYTFHGRFYDGNSGKLAITKRGPGIQRMVGSFTGGYTGGLRIEDGLLDYEGTMPENCDYTVTGGTLDIGNNVSSIGVFQITGGTVEGAGMLTSSAPYDVRGGAVDAVLAGDVGLNKTGTATAFLTDANLYTGTTTIGAGTLALAGEGQISPFSPIVNNATFLIADGVAPHTVGSITGSGTTRLLGNDAQLIATSIVQGTLIIGSGGDGMPASASSPVVPEPSVWTLLLIALIGFRFYGIKRAAPP